MDFLEFHKAKEKERIEKNTHYFVQYFSPTTHAWQEIRKTYATKEEALNVAYSYGDKKVRVVTYINGERTYQNIN